MNFIMLTETDNSVIALRADDIVAVQKDNDHSQIYLRGDSDPFYVKENVDQVLSKIEELEFHNQVDSVLRK